MLKFVFFCYTILRFTHSHSGPLGDIKGFVQDIPGTYESENPINFSGSDEYYLKCDSINRSTVSGVRVPILCSFASYKSPG